MAKRKAKKTVKKANPLPKQLVIAKDPDGEYPYVLHDGVEEASDGQLVGVYELVHAGVAQVTTTLV